MYLIILFYLPIQLLLIEFWTWSSTWMERGRERLFLYLKPGGIWSDNCSGSYLCKGNNRSKGQKAGRHQYVSGQGPHSGVGNIQVSTQGQQPGMVRWSWEDIDAILCLALNADCSLADVYRAFYGLKRIHNSSLHRVLIAWVKIPVTGAVFKVFLFGCSDFRWKIQILRDLKLVKFGSLFKKN